MLEKNTSIIEIPETEFSEKTKRLGDRAIIKYMNRYALGIPVSENEIYVNIKGDCYIAASLSVLDSLLADKEGKGSNELTSIKLPLIDSHEIKQKVRDFLDSLSISSLKIDEKTIQLVERKIKNMPNRNLQLTDLYFVVGEYFNYAFKNKITWKHEFDRQINDTVPILFYAEQNKDLFYAKELNGFLLNGQIGGPIKMSIEQIFYIINKK